VTGKLLSKHIDKSYYYTKLKLKEAMAMRLVGGFGVVVTAIVTVAAIYDSFGWKGGIIVTLITLFVALKSD